MKFLALSVISIALLIGPVLGDFRDILEICNQTPYTGLFRKYLLDNPDVLVIYQALKNSTIYVPSDRAMKKHFANKNSVRRRATASATVQAQYMIEQQANAIKEAQKQARSVRRTADTRTSPDGGNSVIVTVNNGSPPIKRHFYMSQADTGVYVMSGAGETAKILFGDIQSIQGIIHVVDSFFNVPEPVTNTLKYTGNTKFLDATNAADLGPTFDTMGQITVFVPIDSAFEGQPKLDAASIKSHTVYGVALYSTLLVDGAIFKTAKGSSLYVDVINGVIHINCIPLVQSDILASGGAIHTVATILEPVWSKPYCS